MLQEKIISNTPLFSLLVKNSFEKDPYYTHCISSSKLNLEM